MTHSDIYGRLPLAGRGRTQGERPPEVTGGGTEGGNPPPTSRAPAPAPELAPELFRTLRIDPAEVPPELCWTDDRWPASAFFPLYSARGFDVGASPLELDGNRQLEPPGEGLILADALGDLWLSGRALADGSAAADLVREVGVLVVEGAGPFLQAATERSDADEAAPCILGLPGPLSWTQEIADRIPDGAKVGLSMGPEAERQILRTLADRLRADRIEVVRVSEHPRGGRPR